MSSHEESTSSFFSETFSFFVLSIVNEKEFLSIRWLGEGSDMIIYRMSKLGIWNAS